MHVQRTSSIVSSLCMATPLLASCSVSYDVRREDAAKATVANPGVYYMLPKTELLSVLSITRKKERPARLSDEAWETCVAACVLNVPDRSCKASDSALSTSYDIASAKLYSRYLADTQYLYRVNVNFGTFAGFNHSFKLSDQGVLTYASAELENKAVEVAINTTKAIAKIAVSAGARLAPPAEERLECPDFLKLHGLKKDLDLETEKIRNDFERALYAHPTLSAPAVAELALRRDEKIKLLREDLKYKTLLADRKAFSETKSLGDYAAAVIPTQDTVEISQWAAIQQFDLEGYEGLQAMPADLDEKDAVLKRLAEERFRLKVARAVQFGAATDPEPLGADRSSKYGFRYRVPAAATVQVVRAEKKEKSDKTQKVDKADSSKVMGGHSDQAAGTPPPAAGASAPATAANPDIVIASARMPVAQYGALVSLPAKVKGVKAKVVLDMYEGTGAPKQVDVGATPQPSTLVGDVLSPVQEELDRRNKAEADEAAAAAGAEVAELTKERDVLKLKHEIEELKEALENSEEGEE